MKRTTHFLLAVSLLCISPAILCANAVANETAVSEQSAPLMVIRFNQAHIDYPMPLYNTLNQALAAKSSARFDIVSVAPRARQARNQGYYDRMAAQNAGKVLATLHEIGMPDRRLNLSTITDEIDSSEVRIYVH